MPAPTLLRLALAFPPTVALDRADTQSILLIESQRLPPEALHRYVESEDPDARARAALALGRLRTEAALPYLDVLARDPDARVRSEAAFALGQTPDAERSLLGYYRDETDPSVRPLWLEALGKQADVAGLRVLVDALHQEVGFLETPLEAEAAALALGRVALRDRDALSRPDLVEQLVAQLDRMHRDTRRATAFALGRIRPDRLDPSVAERLVQRTVSEPDAVTQAFLVRALATVQGIDAARADAYGHTATDPDPSVRIATARAAPVCDWRPVAALLSDPNPQVRHVAIEAVAEMPALDRRGLLLPIIDAGDTLEAAEDLLTTGAPQMLDAVVALRSLAGAGVLTDPEPWLTNHRPTPIRAAAVGAVTDPARLRAFAMDDSEAPVRSAAAMRMAMLELPVHELVPLLDATDAMVAAIAAEALTAQPDAASEGPLLAVLQDAIDADLLAYGLGALAALYAGESATVRTVDPAALTLARDVATHPHSRVRAAAADILTAAGETPPPAWNSLRTVPVDEVLQVTSARVHTDRGEFIVDLAPELAPITVWNFVQLAEDGWYDGVPWHRVVPDFVAQTGDPRGDGTGGPAWTIPDEINRLTYAEGVLGMAHAGPDTAGSQWFVTLSPQPHLDGGYTAFGRVTLGMPVVQQLQPSDRIRAVTIERRDTP